MPHFCHKLSVHGEVISLYSISAIVFTTPPQFTVVCSWGLAATLILFWVLIVRRLWSYSPKTHSPQTHGPQTLHFYSPMDSLYSPMDSLYTIVLWTLLWSADSFHGPQTLFMVSCIDILLSGFKTSTLFRGEVICLPKGSSRGR